MKRRHYYILVFLCGGTDISTASYMCRSDYKRRCVTSAMISNGKKYLGLPDNAMLLSVSYLGHMTDSEYHLAEYYEFSLPLLLRNWPVLIRRFIKGLFGKDEIK